MSITCSIFGHKLDNGVEREVIEEHNGEEVSVKVLEKECQRCDYSKRERVKTTIRNENEDVSKNKEEKEQEKEQENKEESNFSISDRSYDRKSDSLNPERLPDEGAIIIEDSKDSKENNKELKQKITCKSCNYEGFSETQNHRSGDCCPECSGWLKVETVR